VGAGAVPVMPDMVADTDGVKVRGVTGPWVEFRGGAAVGPPRQFHLEFHLPTTDH
jgi:hypothetical protein